MPEGKPDEKDKQVGLTRQQRKGTRHAKPTRGEGGGGGSCMSRHDNPKCNGRNVGLPPSSFDRMTGLGGKLV